MDLNVIQIPMHSRGCSGNRVCVSGTLKQEGSVRRPLNQTQVRKDEGLDDGYGCENQQEAAKIKICKREISET